MSRKPKIDHEILSILEDYHLFMDSDKSMDMPFCVDKVDNNHVTSLKGEADLNSAAPLGNTVLECVILNLKWMLRVISWLIWEEWVAQKMLNGKVNDLRILECDRKESHYPSNILKHLNI